MNHVLILGDTGAIGAALKAKAAARGAQVSGLSRPSDGADVTDEAFLAAAISRLTGAFDTVIVATVALRTAGQGAGKGAAGAGSGRADAAVRGQGPGPVLVLKHALRLMPKDRVVRFAALSARVGSIGDNGLGGWYCYRAAKAAQNQLVHIASIELTRSHPQSIVVTLHPATVETPLTDG